MMKWRDFVDTVRAHGLQPVDRGQGHWQIKGGRLLVNFYPLGRDGPVYYVAGTKAGIKGGVAEAIAAANSPPAVAAKKDRRRNKYGRIKRQLRRRDPHCRWCRCFLVLKREDAINGRRLATIEHVIPLNRGGLDNLNNMALACEPCNLRRGGDMPELEAP